MVPQVRPFFHAPSNTWSYVVAEGDGGAAAIVDPVLDFDAKSGRTDTVSAELLLADVRRHGLQVDWILETHAHADHLSAAQWLKARLPGARVAIGEGIRAVQQAFAPLFALGEGDGFATDGSQFDHLFGDGERFAIGAVPVRVIAVPGHTGDGCAYLAGDALFAGDSLFMPDGGSARCDFPGGDATLLFRSIRRLFELPGETRVFVCHDYGPGGRAVACETTIAAQRRDNIHVRDGIDEGSFVALRQARDATLDIPALLLPAIQVNIRAGALPDPDANGIRYLKLPLDAL